MKKEFLLTFCLTGALLAGSVSGGADQQTVRERVLQAQKYVSDGEMDFAFMEYRALLEEHPEDPSARMAAFAIGEYHFNQHNVREAKEAFERFHRESPDEVPNLLSDVYLLLCARFLKDTDAAHDLESRLKEVLSSKKLFLAFEDNRVQEWTSPLGNHFKLREFVDHMEITVNDALFYSITLP